MRGWNVAVEGKVADVIDESRLMVVCKGWWIVDWWVPTQLVLFFFFFKHSSFMAL